MASKQAVEQLRVAQGRGRRRDRNVGITQACEEELRRHASGRTARWLARRTGYPLQAVKNALHHLQHVMGGVTSQATSNGAEHIFMLYTAPAPRVYPDDGSFAVPITVGRGSRWWAEV